VCYSGADANVQNHSRLRAGTAHIGAGLVEGVQIIRDHDHNRREIFDQRLKCKKLAEDYVKANSDNYTSVFLDRADFSTSRNSCIASTNEHSGGAQFTTYKLVDVVTGELLPTDFCDNHDSQSTSFCGNGRDMKLRRERDEAFAKVVK
jgi:hypothetical protein